jgi:hypothetical protein
MEDKSKEELREEILYITENVYGDDATKLVDFILQREATLKKRVLEPLEKTLGDYVMHEGDWERNHDIRVRAIDEAIKILKDNV